MALVRSPISTSKGYKYLLKSRSRHGQTRKCHQRDSHNMFKSYLYPTAIGVSCGMITLNHSFADAMLPQDRTNLTVISNLSQQIDQEVQDKSLTARITKIAEDIRHVLRYCRRILAYCLYGAPVACLAPVAYVIGDLAPATEDMIWKYVVWSIEQLGPTFVKFAQWASTRPDLYPPKLIERLKKLQDDVTVRHSISTVERTLEDAFGTEWKKSIDLDPQPIGAGCVAQVFKGVLKAAGVNKEDQAVAIKLIHPHVEKMVRTDMELLGFLANVVDSFPNLAILNLGETMRQFGETMKDQLDLRKEAFNLKKFGIKFASESWAKFPAPIEGFIHKNVLVETLMEGIPLSDFMKGGLLKEDGYFWLKGKLEPITTRLKIKLADLGARAILKMIFVDNFVHGDLHPGNVLVQFNDLGNPRFVFLDCGIIFQSPTESHHKSLIDVCLAFMKKDGQTAATLMIQNANHLDPGNLSFRNSGNNTQQFVQGVQKMIDDSEHELFYEHLGEYVTKICDLARQFKIQLDPGYFHIAMALKVVEGVVLSLNREFDMITECLPIIAKAEAFRKLGITRFPVPEDDEGTAPPAPARKS